MGRATELIRDAADIDELRTAQAVLLPLLGLTLDQTAVAVGKSKYWVSRARNAVLAGRPPPKAHGGRRKAVVPQDDEVELLREAIWSAPYSPGRQSPVRTAVRELLEQRRGGTVAESTVTAFLNRAVPKLMPQLKGADLRQVAFPLARYWQAEGQLNYAIERAKRS